MQDLSDVDVVPKNFDETTRTIKHHEESVKSALCDQRLISLQSDGKGIISDLQKEEEYMSHTEDYRYCPYIYTKPHYISHLKIHCTLYIDCWEIHTRPHKMYLNLLF